MGKIIFEAYQPHQINWRARGMVEAWTRQPVAEMPLQKDKTMSAGIVFCLITLVLAVGTWVIFI